MLISREIWRKASPWSRLKARSSITVLALLAIVATISALSASAGTARAADAGPRYLDALRAFKTLSSDGKAGEFREKWQDLDASFVAVYRADPDGPTAPKALFYRGWVYEELARRSFLKKDYADAAELYLRMVERFPGHDWADDALYRRAEILLQRLGDKNAARADLERALADYPSGDKGQASRELLASFDPGNSLLRQASAPAPAPPPEPATAQGAARNAIQPSEQASGQARPQAQNSPQPAPQARVQAVFPAPQVPAAKPATPDSPATLQAVETSVENGVVRVALVLDRETTYRYQLLGKQKKGDGLVRLYIDLDNAAIGARVPRDMKTPDNVIRRIRAAYNRPGVVRVVLDMEDHARHAVFSLDSPFRVVLDLTGTRPVETAAAAAPADAAAKPEETPGQAQQAAREPDVFSNWVKNLFETDGGKQKTVSSAQVGTSSKPAQTVAVQTAPAKKAPPAKVEKYKPPAGSKQRLGDLIEQLGLTVKNIMVDPGHGGKDPGAQGLYGIVEKNLNLRFAKILGGKLSEHGFNVSYTRTKDEFVSLEKRTEMANEKNTDLFISVHCNAHGSENSNGLETYSLNLARTEDAVRVAARENAVSAKQISDLQLILTDLMLNSKMKESRELAKTVQNRAIKNVKSFGAKDRGPHEAPFYVLMGAKMPAILVELGYITNKKEARRLNSDKYLDSLAQGLVNGVIAYKKQIERFASIAKPRA